MKILIAIKTNETLLSSVGTDVMCSPTELIIELMRKPQLLRQ